MSRDELQARSKALFEGLVEAACHRFGLDRAAGFDARALGEPEPAFEDPWLEDGERQKVVAELRAQHGAYVDEITNAADAICRHEFTFFGTPVRYGPQIAWQADPVSGRPWPREFYTRVGIFGGDTGHGDVKYVWELNRHQFLPVLGKAYRLTGDEKYASAGLALIDDWIEANPWRIGINWTSALEVAVRSLSWCWATALFEGSAAMSRARRQQILQSLAQHGRYLERHLSFYFSPYNHLIGEATALFVMGSLLPMLQPAARWRERGWEILDDQMPKQFHPDGGTVEQATGYHFFTLGFYLQAILLRKHLGGDVGSRMWIGAERALDFAMYMMRPDGRTPMIGDGDDGKAFQLLQPHPWDFRVFLALGAALFRRGDFNNRGGSVPPDALWLLGTAGRGLHDSVRDDMPLETSKALPSSGYYVMRTGWNAEAHYLAFDSGEISAGVSHTDTPSAAHGHADALGIEVAAFGEPMLVDPGFWTYNGNETWHRYFRETEAHNTVVVDGRSQAEFRGRLKWSHAPRVEPYEWISLASFDCAGGQHYGYQRLEAPVVHRRTVVFLKRDYWVVRDELIGEGEHTIDRHFHFAAPDATAHGLVACARTTEPGRPNLAVAAVEPGGALGITRGGEAASGGWLAVGYEQKLEASIARFRTAGSLPCGLHTLLVPFRGARPEIAIEERPIESDARSALDRAFLVSQQGRRDVWAFSGGRTARFHDGWVTDARWALVRMDDRSRTTGFAFVWGSVIEIDGTPLVLLDRRVRAAALSMTDGFPVLELSEPAEIRVCRLGKPIVVVKEHALPTAS
jgi:hypothetical protein